MGFNSGLKGLSGGYNNLHYLTQFIVTVQTYSTPVLEYSNTFLFISSHTHTHTHTPHTPHTHIHHTHTHHTHTHLTHTHHTHTPHTHTHTPHTHHTHTHTPHTHTHTHTLTFNNYCFFRGTMVRRMSHGYYVIPTLPVLFSQVPWYSYFATGLQTSALDSFAALCIEMWQHQIAVKQTDVSEAHKQQSWPTH